MRKPFLSSVSFVLGCIATSTILVACDRSAVEDTRAEEPAATRTAEAPRAQPEAQQHRAQQPAAARATPPREALADTVITGKIKSAILGDPAMAGADVSVNTDHGVVALSGLVKNPEQIAVASGYAQRQDGVMRVDNHLALARE